MQLSLYQDQLQQLFGRRRTGTVRTLDDVRQLVAHTSVSSSPPSVIQIVGTNGKGSTAACLEQMLRGAGYRTGLFTSPHLLAFEERFRIDGTPITPVRLAPHLQAVLDAAALHGLDVPFFDMATAIGWRLFQAEQVDVVVCEAGMGGRNDATSVLPSAATCITSVGLDHQQWLGPTVVDIARDKAGAFRPNTPIFSSVLEEEYNSVLRQIAKERQAGPFFQLTCDFHIEATEDGLCFDWAPNALPEGSFSGRSLSVPSIALALQGSFQYRNFALAAACFVWWQTQRQQTDASHTPGSRREATHAELASWIRIGAASVRWMGRWEERKWKGHSLLIDGAHNPAATQALAESLPKQPWHLICAAANDKPLTELQQPLWPHIKTASFCRFSQPRAATKDEFLQAIVPLQKQGNVSCVRFFESVGEALERLYDEEVTSPILIVGSLFLVADTLAFLQNGEKADS